MFHSLDTTAWLSVVSRRKLQQAAASPDRPRDADKLLRKVLLRNSISRVDLALAEAQASSSPLSHSSLPTLPSPQQRVLPLHSSSGPESPVTLPNRPEEDDFVFPDATSLTASQSYSAEDAEAEARWFESLIEDLSDDEDDEDLSRTDDSHAGDVTFSHEGEAEEEEEEEDDEEGDFDLDLLWSTNSEPQTLIVIPPLPPPPPQQDLSLQDLPPFYYPLPDDEDDDLSTTPGMEEDVEDESEADSLEWPTTPGHRSITSLLGRSVSTSSLNQLVASAGRDNSGMGTTALPSITEGAVYEHSHSVRPAIHVDEPQLYRYSPAPREQSLATTTTTPALEPSC